MVANAFFARIWAALVHIGRIGAKPAGYVANIVRRIGSVGFISRGAPVIWRALRAHGGAVASLIALWYGFRGELLSVEDALKLAKEKGLDELMQSRNETEVLREFIKTIPGVSPEAKQIFEKAFVDGTAAAQAEVERQQQQQQAPATTLVVPQPVQGKRTPDAAIESALATSDAGSQGAYPRSAANSNIGAPAVFASLSPLEKVRVYERFVQDFLDRHNLNFETFARDLTLGSQYYAAIATLAKKG